MGVKRIREDSVKELSKRKTNEQLAKENEALRKKAEAMEAELTPAQEALCDVYEMILGGGE